MSWQLELALWTALVVTTLLLSAWAVDFAEKQMVKR